MRKDKPKKNNKKTKIPNFNIVSLVIAILAIYSTYDIANRSGSFDKPEFEIRIGNMQLTKSKNLITFGSPISFSYEDKILPLSSFPLYIKNSGKKSLEKINITFRYDEIHKRQDYENLDFKSEGTMKKEYVSRVTTQMGNNYFESYNFEFLNPELGLNIIEPIIINYTNLEINDNFIDKNGKTFSTKISANYNLKFNININAKDTPNEDYFVEYSIVKCNSFDELTKLVQSRLTKERQEVRERDGFFSYLINLIFLNKDLEEVIIFPKYQESQIDNLKLYYEYNPNYKTLIYPQYSWKLLI